MFANFKKMILDFPTEYVSCEGFGTPGSGKSYICSQLSSYLSTDIEVSYHSIDNYPSNFIIRSFVKLFLIFRFLLFDFKLIVACFNVLRCFKDLSFKNEVKLFFNLLLVSSVILSNNNKKSISVLDQGVIQSFWSFFYYNKLRFNSDDIGHLVKALCSLIDTLPLSRLIVLNLCVDNSVILKRLASRKLSGTSPLNSLMAEDLLKGIYSTNICRLVLCEASKATDKIVVFDYEN